MLKLTPNIVNDILTKYRFIYESQIKTKFPEDYTKIQTEIGGNSFREKLYKWIHPEIENIGICPNCGQPSKFDDIFYGFRKYCSSKCSNSSSDVKSKKEKAYLKSLGVKNPSSSSEIKEKKKQTFIEHYGADCNLRLESTKEQIKKTNREKYGTDYPIQNTQVKNKREENNLIKYGVKHVSQIEESELKRKNTCFLKYGKSHPAKSSLIHEKIELTNLKRYGTRHYAQSDASKRHVWNKFYQTLITSDRLKGKLIPLFSHNEYDGVDKTYAFKCLKCGNKFLDHMGNGRIPRCYVCYPKLYCSYGEKEIFNFIKSLDKNLMLETNTTNRLKSGKELDIFIPKKNIAIEFDGLFWHSERGGKRLKNYHLSKTDECESQNIKLIHIFEDEWINKQEIVKNKIKYILGYHKSEKIYARNCVVKCVSRTDADKFLNEYHIQGNVYAPICLGLYNNDELVSLMSFGKLRPSLGSKTVDSVYEMYRFCSKTSVVGGASKLLSHFLTIYNPIKIISYADRRWSSTIENTLYSKIGFNLVEITKPNYYYLKDYIKREFRFNFRKNILNKKFNNFDPNLSEWENMQLNGYDRIWDCGSLKYEFTPNKCTTEFPLTNL